MEARHDNKRTIRIERDRIFKSLCNEKQGESRKKERGLSLCEREEKKL